MGTHPIFESDFDCLTDPSNRSQWSSDCLIDVDWLTTPPLTVARSSRRPVESSFTSELRRPLPSQSAATPRSPSEASELSDHEKLPSFLDDRRLSPERTVAPSPAAPSDPESSELSSSTNRRWLSRSSRPSRAPSKLLSLLPCE